MKRRRVYCIVLAMMLIAVSIIRPIHAEADDGICGYYFVTDTKGETEYPDRFRIAEKFNISGSAQFTPKQLPRVLKKINKKSVYVVDLRQESHGFFNDERAVRLFSPFYKINEGFSSSETLAAEKNLFDGLKRGRDIQMYNKFGQKDDIVALKSTSIERNVVRDNNADYILFAVRDNTLPMPEVVDNFVEFSQKVHDKYHLHFHCLAGVGRTTSFMIMYQTMFDNAPIGSIIDYQESIADVDFSKDTDRINFFKCFSQYVNENKPTGYKKPFSKWLKEDRFCM